jgi:2,3-bisphosphoglycerate-independent phosphoglycerate mutase
MEPIQIIGMDEVDSDIDKGTVNKLANEYHEKIQRLLNNITSVTLHIKKHSKGGKAKKWDMRVKAVAPTRIFEAQESDWDLARSLHKVFRNVEREIEHKLHTDSQRDKGYE